VPVGGTGCYGIALHVLLSRRQSQKVAHGEISGAGKFAADCPAEAQKASSSIEYAAAIVVSVLDCRYHTSWKKG